MKIGAFIPVRLGSSRLPRKHMEALAGRPMLYHLLDRAFASKHLQRKDVVVCTTTDPSDDELVEFVESAGASVFRGSRDDIIKRYCDAVRHLEFDIVAQLFGDDPLTDPDYVDRCIETLLADESLDIVESEGLPIGVNSSAIRRRAFEKVEKSYLTQRNDTGYMWYFTKTGLCKMAAIHPASDKDVHPTAWLTLDYPEDLALFRAIFERLYVPGKVFRVADVVALLKAEPDLLKINAHIRELCLKRTEELAKLEYQDSAGHTVAVKARAG